MRYFHVHGQYARIGSPLPPWHTRFAFMSRFLSLCSGKIHDLAYSSTVSTPLFRPLETPT
jgi:hypothetical protein